MTNSIDALVGDFAEFGREFYNKKPMLRKGALPTVQDDVMSLADVDELINLEVVRFPYIKVNLNGSGVPEAGYTKDIVVQGATQTGVVDPEKVHALYRAGGTITWASVNQIFPKVREFVRMVNDAMATRTDAVAFLTPAGKKGYPAHHDGVDLFIIQLSGTKHWRLWDLADDRRSESASYTEESLGAPVIETSLQPGDVLYLPYGTPHQASAEGEPSLHLSIMMRPRMWRELLKETVDRALSDEAFLTNPPVFGDLDAGVEQEFNQQLDRLRTQLDALEVSVEWDRYRQAGRTVPGVSSSAVFQQSAATARINGTTSLRRAAVPYASQMLEDGRVQLELTGLKFAVTPDLADKLKNLEPGSATTTADLLGDVPAERQQKVAKVLVGSGLFVVAA